MWYVVVAGFVAGMVVGGVYVALLVASRDRELPSYGPAEADGTVYDPSPEECERRREKFMKWLGM